MEYLVRFLAGGVVVSVFAMLADIIRPKSLAGLLSASPAVALVTLSITFANKEPAYASIEGRSMILGSVALSFYSAMVCCLLVRTRLSALTASLISLPVWLIISLSFLTLFPRRL